MLIAQFGIYLQLYFQPSLQYRLSGISYFSSDKESPCPRMSSPDGGMETKAGALTGLQSDHRASATRHRGRAAGPGEHKEEREIWIAKGRLL